MDCKECKINNRAVDPVPYISHEEDMARLERTIKRLWIALIIVILLFAGSNLAWTIYEAQFKTVITQDVEQQADGYGNNQFVGGDMVGSTEGKTTKSRQRKTGGNSGYRKCNMCHGTGRIRSK